MPSCTSGGFDSLYSRDFRWFWLGRLATSTTMQIRSVAQGWLVYQLTGSALALGWVSSARSVARLLLSLYGGVLADRIERRQFLIWTRAGMLLNALAIAVLVVTGAVRVWHAAFFAVTRLPPVGNEAINHTSVWADLREGVHYLKAYAPLLPLLGIAVVRALFDWSYRTLMPVYAEEVLHFDARGLGILSAVPSIGSLIGSLGLASLGNSQSKGKILLAAGLAMGLSLVAFANVPYFGLVLPFF